ncbi:MAG: hypothetical protein KDK12_14430 [Rhodobacteraceae bacterium]|nr:hypothetical protein [Paracoccaceae bacterium]
MTFLLVTRTAAELAAQDLTEYRTRCIALVDEHVDARARALGYKDAVSCVSYCGSTVAQWAAEAATFSAWRDAVWLAVIAFDAAPPPGDAGSVEPGALIAALPAWPG